MYYLPAAGMLVAYLLLVRVLRYRRRDGILRRFSYKTREEMASMSLSDAATVFRELAEKEFPTIFYTSVSFALFKTYGIPTISKLLVATSQLSGEMTASKRRTDTGVLMTEIMFNKPDCPRNIEAVARVNFLHDRWRKAGKISNDDMLYTLSLFTLEPVRWTAQYEWRDLSLLEKNAVAIFWRDLGRQMAISYDCLAPYMDREKQQQQHQQQHQQPKNDPVAWLDALAVWSVQYQKDNMVYAIPNEKLAEANVRLLLLDLPRWMHGFVFGQLRCFMEPQLRRAMGYEDPSKLQLSVFHTLMNTRRWFVKYFCLPRPKWWTSPMLLDVDEKTGRYFLPSYLAHPYYVKPTLYARWGPAGLYSRLIGGCLPGDEGAKYSPDGYVIPEVGPEAQKGKGGEYMNTVCAKISKARGCPMAFGGAQCPEL